jgi:nicotinate-nucleotide pyrophosphorylase (carboxylating)
MTPEERQHVASLVELAKAEDFGSGDRTTALMERPGAGATFRLLMKQPGVFAGRDVAAMVLAAYDGALRLDWAEAAADGATTETVPAALATVSGPLGSILAAERVLLNFVQRLCGVATLTRRFVVAVEGTGARIYDTRKTTPGWRALEKFAVRCGGGRNHRKGLFDAVLIKDNHLVGVETHRLAGAVFEMLNRMSPSADAPAMIEVEADSLEQVEELLKIVGIEAVLLDNFSLDDLRAAVRLRDEYGLRGKVALEASGGITLGTVRAVAETGVERISVGAITHSATAIDLSLERV